MGSPHSSQTSPVRDGGPSLPPRMRSMTLSGSLPAASGAGAGPVAPLTGGSPARPGIGPPSGVRYGSQQTADLSASAGLRRAVLGGRRWRVRPLQDRAPATVHVDAARHGSHDRRRTTRPSWAARPSSRAPIDSAQGLGPRRGPLGVLAAGVAQEGAGLAAGSPPTTASGVSDSRADPKQSLVPGDEHALDVEPVVGHGDARQGDGPGNAAGHEDAVVGLRQVLQAE